MAKLDDIDRNILRTLQKSPDLPIADLAGKVGLSHTPCWRRVKRMESEGIIEKRAVVLNQAALGLAVTVIANLKLKQHDEATLEALERAARNLPEIVSCFSMAGESDYLLRVVVSTIEDYERFLKKVLLHLPGVAAINSSFVLKPIKLTTDLPV